MSNKNESQTEDLDNDSNKSPESLNYKLQYYTPEEPTKEEDLISSSGKESEDDASPHLIKDEETGLLYDPETKKYYDPVTLNEVTNFQY